MKDVIVPAFGKLKSNGMRQYRFVYIEIPKKNGKTEMASGIALYGLCGDGEMGAEIYSAAGDIKQASLVFEPAAYMVQNNRILDKRLRVLPSRKRIIDYKSNSFYEVLSAEAFTKHGLNPHVVVIDELHAQPNRELYDVLTEGTDIARTQQLIFIITTAGVADKESIGWEIAQYARQVRDGIIRDPQFLPVIYAIEDDQDWEDKRVWKDLNPSLGQIFELENLELHYKKAKQLPASLNNFLRYRLNKWVSQASRYLPMDMWDKCDQKFKKADLIGRPCYGALDLSSTIDLTCKLLLFPPLKDTEKWRVLCKYYIPKENMLERSKRDNVPYDMWVRAGFITATPGSRVDYRYIKKDLLNDAKIYNLAEVGYDPWGAYQLAIELRDDEGIETIEVRQGYKTMSPPTKELLGMIMEGQIFFGGNPVLRWNADNLAVTTDPADNVKPAKNKSKERIDGVVALIMALDCAMRNPDFESVYDTDEREDGFLTL